MSTTTTVTKSGTIVHTVTLRGAAAIAAAERLGRTLSKSTDPTEDARDGLSVDDARAVAAEDPSLIHLGVEVRLDREEQRSVDVTGTSVEADVLRVALHPEQANDLLGECIDGTEDDDALRQEWCNYAHAVAAAVGVELQMMGEDEVSPVSGVELVSSTGSTDALAVYATVSVTVGGEVRQVGCMLGAPESDRATHLAAGGMPDGEADAWWSDPSDWASVGEEHQEAVLEALRSAAPKLWRAACELAEVRS